MIFVATKMVGQKNFPLPLLVLLLDPGSEIRNPGWIKNRIRDKHIGSATLISSRLGYGIQLVINDRIRIWIKAEP
jgi:hypothetical protein